MRRGVELRGTLAVLVILSIAACGGEDAAGEGEAQVTSEEICAQAAALDPDTVEARESGLRVQVLEEGTGPAAEPGDTLVVHYTGCLTDGTPFDSSREREEPFRLVLGQGQVIPGWDEGLEGTRPGGERRLVIPPDMAYGPEGAGDVIPPNATLLFDVELLEIVGAPADTAEDGSGPEAS